MNFRKVLILLLCLGFIGCLPACINKNKVKETNSFSDEYIYGKSTIQDLLKLSKEQDIAYAGKFIDEKGTLNIALVYNTARNIEQKEMEEKINNINNSGVIKIKMKIIDAQFSFKELKNANKILVKNIKKLEKKGLTGFEIDEKKNRIIVYVEKINEDIKNEISKLIDISLVIIEEGLKPTFN